jgi:hypothetical protein
MTDSPFTDPQPDDERLLAYVLRAEDDPELLTAADPQLARRLDELRVEVSAVAEQVNRAVPLPDEHYTDLDAPRWRELNQYLRPAPVVTLAPHGQRGGTSRWLRILAPAAALLLAVGVGAAVLRNSQSGGGAALSTFADKQAQEVASPAASALLGYAGRRILDLEVAREFAIVLVARARSAQGGYQWFDVVRVLRGTAPPELRLHVESVAAQPGFFHVVYLAPTNASQAPQPKWSSPSPGPGDSATAALRFTEEGQQALVVQLAADVAPDDVSLPQP